MIFLFLAIFSSAFIFILFKLFPSFSVNTYHAIVINYLTAGTCGFIFNANYTKIPEVLYSSWLVFAIFIGILLLVTFLLIKYSTQNIGVSITTIASKMSVVIPVVFSIIYDNEFLSIFKLLGIMLAILAIFLLVKTEPNNDKIMKKWWITFMPLLLFLGLGISDSLVKFIQNAYIDVKDASLFTSSLFFCSFVASFFYGLTQKNFIPYFKNIKNYIGGVILGLCNFGSLYFLIKALYFSGLDSSLVFGVVNLGIVVLSVLIGFTLFKEKLLKINWLGFVFAIVAIILMTSQHA
ncbi:MAG: DMT family transporter [Bacteroidales bacterium]|nr:DMT family transporter [Bacteroidales bacterium]